jgi:hypothetical protein
MKSKPYGMKVDSLVRGIEVTQQDLDFLCSLVELPDEDYAIPDAIDYSCAVVALYRQLQFMVEELAGNPLTEDEDIIKLSKEELETLTDLSDAVEDALGRLRECGISLKQN